MQVRDVVAKDIDVDLLGIGALAQGAGDAGEDCAQRGGFWSVQPPLFSADWLLSGAEDCLSL